MSDALERIDDGRARVPWAEPSPNVRAVVQRIRRDGQLRDPVDRRGRLKALNLTLIAADPPAREPRDVGLTDADWNWVLSAGRRSWPAIAARWRAIEEAERVAMGLVEAGVIELDMRTAPVGRTDHEPKAWRLTGPWVERREARDGERRASREALSTRAHELAVQMEVLDVSFARALRRTADHTVTLRVLVAAAADLLAGVTHDGPRAFSQVHFERTKAREDAPALLRDAGVREESIATLGLARSPYVGLGGALTVPGIDLARFGGPVRLRATGVEHWGVALASNARALLLVENLQAAEAVCDRFPDVAVVWFAGQPADAVLDVCIQIAARAKSLELPVFVAPDADLGGVYIARRVIRALPRNANTKVVDAGDSVAAGGRTFSEQTRAVLARLTEDDSPLVRDFAQAVLARGRPVEQEAAIRKSVVTALAGLG